MSEDDDNLDHMDIHDQMVLTDTAKASETSNKKAQVQMTGFFAFTVHHHFYFVAQWRRTCTVTKIQSIIYYLKESSNEVVIVQ